MNLEQLLPEISGSTRGWNDQVKLSIDAHNEVLKLAFVGAFTYDSPFLIVKMTDREIKRELRKNNNTKWLTDK